MQNINKISNNLVKAFLKNKIIKPIPLKYTKNILLAEKLRKLCESKINKKIIGFKAGGTAIPVLKKLNEKEPFYASVFENNLLKSGKSVKINKYTLGIELEVCFLISKNFFKSKRRSITKNIHKFITHFAPCIEVVGYRQKKKGIKYLGDLSSDFGANIKFLIGKKIKYRKKNFSNLNTKISNNNSGQLVKGNTNTVYINPINSCKFVLKKLIKDKISLNYDFFIFTGSTVGVVPIKKGKYYGKIDKVGSVKALIR